MGLLSLISDWMLHPNVGSGYKKFKPEEGIWYHYHQYDNCGTEDLKERNIPYKHTWECCEIRSFALIKGKKHRAKFKIIDDHCIVIVKKRKLKFPLDRCSFAYKFKYYHHKRINPYKRKRHDKSFIYSPSRYGEYHVTVLVKR